MSREPLHWIQAIGGKCQIIKLFNSSLSLYSWLLIKQHSISVNRERQWMTLSRWGGLNPCKLLGSTDWQLMFSPAAADETFWSDFESSNFPATLMPELPVFLILGRYCSLCHHDFMLILCFWTPKVLLFSVFFSTDLNWCLLGTAVHCISLYSCKWE